MNHVREVSAGEREARREEFQAITNPRRRAILSLLALHVMTLNALLNISQALDRQ